MPRWVFWSSCLPQTSHFKLNPLISTVFILWDISYLFECLAISEDFSSSTHSIHFGVPLWLIFLFLFHSIDFSWLVSFRWMSSTSPTYFWPPKMYASSPYFFSELQSYVCNWLLYIIPWMSHKHFKCNKLKLHSLALTPELIPCSILILFLLSGSTT